MTTDLIVAEKPEISDAALAKHAREMYDLLSECYGRMIQRGYFGIAYDIQDLQERVKNAEVGEIEHT